MVLPETPICPAPLPSVRTETRSSASRPITTSRPPESEASLAKATSASSNCGVAFTVFSAKVTPAARPVRDVASTTFVTVMATARAALLSVPSEAVAAML